LSAGIQTIKGSVNGGNVKQAASGIYFYRLSAAQSIYNGKISVVNN
jgi:hypothetical protein